MPKFSISLEIANTPETFLEAIFDTANWTSFTGWGPIPGIKHANLTMPDHSKVGATIDVVNDDGSRHRETVIEFEAGKRLIMRMDNFSAPLNRLATHFIEYWEIIEGSNSHRLIRGFELHPKNTTGKLALPIVALFLKKAVRKHTNKLAQRSG